MGWRTGTEARIPPAREGVGGGGTEGWRVGGGSLRRMLFFTGTSVKLLETAMRGGERASSMLPLDCGTADCLDIASHVGALCRSTARSP